MAFTPSQQTAHQYRPHAAAAAAPTRQAVRGEGRTLILGDENFTFAPCFMSQHPNVVVEVASCLPESRIPMEYKQNLQKLKEHGVVMHYGINPAMLRQHFGMTEAFERVVFVLPGIAFQGCPKFVNKQTDSLFKLRLHLYLFGFMKSSQQTLVHDALVQMIWPNQESDGVLLRGLPWQQIDIAKLAPFCKVLRAEADDLSIRKCCHHANWLTTTIIAAPQESIITNRT